MQLPQNSFCTAMPSTLYPVMTIEFDMDGFAINSQK